MTTRHHSTLALLLLLALGAPQLAACESNAAAAAPAAPTEEPSGAVAVQAPSAPRTAPADDSTEAPSPTAPAALPEGVAPPRAARFGARGTTSTSDTVTVRRLVVAHDVVDREPIVREGAFTAGEDRVFAFVEARNPDVADASIRIYFDGPNGQRVGDIGLAVPGAQRRWRTWGFSRYVTAPGTWEAVVVDDAGTVLAREAFEVR
ncbi:MAG: DUF2914 domain-containing protein [Polyangiales bacterium]|nr:DUF2914 domain-containing protein [Myxococcales bacterium]MCB9659461.1 DUF2914 domain-containing protein [Sandaracinaceae bacterium]